MNRIISLALLVAGIILIIYGVNAADSVSSHISRFFTGSFTDRTMWLLIVGTIASLAGLVGLTRGART